MNRSRFDLSENQIGKKKNQRLFSTGLIGAVDEIRTRDIHLGKVALYH